MLYPCGDSTAPGCTSPAAYRCWKGPGQQPLGKARRPAVMGNVSILILCFARKMWGEMGPFGVSPVFVTGMGWAGSPSGFFTGQGRIRSKGMVAFPHNGPSGCPWSSLGVLWGDSGYFLWPVFLNLSSEGAVPMARDWCWRTGWWEPGCTAVGTQGCGLLPGQGELSRGLTGNLRMTPGGATWGASLPGPRVPDVTLSQAPSCWCPSEIKAEMLLHNNPKIGPKWTVP